MQKHVHILIYKPLKLPKAHCVGKVSFMLKSVFKNMVRNSCIFFTARHAYQLALIFIISVQYVRTVQLATTLHSAISRLVQTVQPGSQLYYIFIDNIDNIICNNYLTSQHALDRLDVRHIYIYIHHQSIICSVLTYRV